MRRVCHCLCLSAAELLPSLQDSGQEIVMFLTCSRRNGNAPPTS